MVLLWNVLVLWNSMFGRQNISTNYRFTLPRRRQLAQSRIHCKRIFIDERFNTIMREIRKNLFKVTLI